MRKVIRASAGAGKTYTLVHEIYEHLRQTQTPDSFLAITFTNEAVQEIQTRLLKKLHDDRATPLMEKILYQGTPLHIYTIDALAQKLLMRFGPRVGIHPYTLVVDGVDNFFWMWELLFALLPHLEKNDSSFLTFYEQTAIDEVTDLRSHMYYTLEALNKASYPQLKSTLEISQKLKDIPSDSLSVKDLSVLRLWNTLAQPVAHLRAQKKTLTLGNVGDLLGILAKELAQAILYELAPSSELHVWIDEAQDTSSAQWEFLRPLVENLPLTLIGDPKQTIYLWRNADVDTFIQLEQQAHRENLPYNRRSAPHIIEFNNLLYRPDSFLWQLAEDPALAQEIQKTLYLNHTQKVPEDISDQSDRKKGYVAWYLFQDSDDQKRKEILENILKRLSQAGYEPQEVVFLVRKNEQKNLLYQLLPDYPFSSAGDTLGSSGWAWGWIYALASKILNPDFIKLAELYGATLLQPFEPQRESLASYILRQLEIARPEKEYLVWEGMYAWVWQAIHRLPLTPELFFLQWQNEGIKYPLPYTRSADLYRIHTIHDFKGKEERVIIIPWADWTPSQPNEPQWNKIYDEGPFHDRWIYTKLSKEIFPKSLMHYKRKSLIEVFNLYYVATTRPKEALFLLTSYTKTTKQGIPHKTGGRMAKILFDNPHFEDRGSYKCWEVGNLHA
ncbi:MAG: UvrD-helicase domain-containing protein [Bacteroidia bacterium]